MTRQNDRFGLLLALLVAAYLLTGVSNEGWTRVVGGMLNLAAVLAAIGAAGFRVEPRRTAILVLVGLTGLTMIGSFPVVTPEAGIGALCQVVVLSAGLGVVLTRVLAHREVRLSTLVGAISGYFLIGLIFAWLYLAIGGFVGGPVLDPPESGLPAYYSFVVLTTLGFGDVSPIDEFTRRITTVEAMIGQIFLATLVARLVTIYGRARPIDAESES